MKPIGVKKLAYRGGVPRHFNCRSTEVPITRSWKELGLPIDEIKEGTRRSMDGEVPASLTMTDWLKQKYETPDGRAMVERIFGKAKAEMFMSGRITPAQMLDQSGRPLSLSQLMERSQANEVYSPLVEQSSLEGDYVEFDADAPQSIDMGDYTYEYRGQTSPEQLAKELDRMSRSTGLQSDYDALAELHGQIVAADGTTNREALKEWRKANKAFNKKYDNLDLYVRQVLDDQLLSDTPGRIDFNFPDEIGNDPILNVAEDAKEWVARLTGGDYNGDLKINTVLNRHGAGNEGIRSYFLPSQHTMVLNKDADPRIITHEFGHWFEDRHPDLKKASQQFYRNRTKGERLQSLGPGYYDYERYKPDAFLNRYMGYEGGQEIFSMGLEELRMNPASLYLGDRDYFDFMMEQIARLQSEYERQSTWRF